MSSPTLINNPMTNTLTASYQKDNSPSLRVSHHKGSLDHSEINLQLPIDDSDIKTVDNLYSSYSRSPQKRSPHLGPTGLMITMKNSSETFEFDTTSRGFSEQTPKDSPFHSHLSRMKASWDSRADDHNVSLNQDSFMSSDGILLHRGPSSKFSSFAADKSTLQLGKINYVALEESPTNQQHEEIVLNSDRETNINGRRKSKSVHKFGEKIQGVKIEELKAEDNNSPQRRPHRAHLALNIPERLEEESQQTTGTQENNLSIGNVPQQTAPQNLAIQFPSTQQQNNANTPVVVRSDSRNGSLVVGQGLEEVLPEIESKLYLKKSMLYFATATILSIVSFFILFEKISCQWVFAVIYGYLALDMLQNYQRIKTEGREDWRVREDRFAVFDTIKWAVYVAGVHLQMLGWVRFSGWHIAPFVVMTLVYLVLSKAPAITRNIRTVLRVLFTLQILLFTFRINFTMDSDWIFVFSILWLYIGIVTIYLIAYTAILLLSFIFLVFQVILKQPIDDRNELRIQFKGLFWHFSYYGLGIACGLIIIGLNDVYSLTGDRRSLIEGLAMTIAITFSLFIYSLVCFKDLVWYIKLYSLTDGALLGSDTFNADQNNTGRDKKEEKITIEIEKKESYFVMLSSTYFKPLNAGLLGKNEERIKKLKEMMQAFRSGKLQQSKNKRNSPQGRINIEALKQDKEALDKKFDCFDEQKFIKRSMKGPLRMTAVVQSPDGRANQTSPARPNPRERNHLSVGDLDGVVNWQPDQESQNISKEEEVCYLCCINPPNAVLMTCGHGGICYDCGLKLVSKKNECMQCRRPVTEIYKVDLNPHLKDVIKGVELCKVIKGKEGKM